MNKNTDYKNLVSYWNKVFSLSKKEYVNYQDLAPSPKLFDVLQLFKGKDNVLDYGCGDGWASIIMAKSGTKHIEACDVTENSITLVNERKKLYQVEDIINAFQIDENWIKNQKEGEFDGFFSSNVIDVIPLDMAEDIIKNAANVVKKDAPVVFSLNYYIDPELMAQRGAIVKGKQVYLEGVLRLTSLKDEEWLKIFKKYYELVSLDYYAWPGEKDETRRLFVLKPLMK